MKLNLILGFLNLGIGEFKNSIIKCNFEGKIG